MKVIKMAAIPAALLVALTGCATGGSAQDGATGGSAQDGAGLTTMKVGISPFQDTYLPIIGTEKGWFEEVGLDVQFQSLAWNAVMPVVASGDIDLAVYATTGVVATANADPEVVYAYAWNFFTEGAAMMVRPDGGIKSVEDLEDESTDRDAARDAAVRQLKGKTIVTTLSTDMGKTVVDALESVGLTQDDVELIDMDTDAGLAAFLAGTGDAYLGGIAQRATALKNGMVAAITGVDLSAPVINGAVMKRSYLESNKDDVLAFVNVMHRIIRFCDAELDECGKIITDRLNEETAGGLTVEAFKDYWQKLELYASNAQESSDMALSKDGISYWKTTWDGDNKYLVETGAIPAEVESAEHFLMPEVWDEYVAKYGIDETGF
ncbi:ABC transporter substrate-binding protein [Cryobacterium sp. M91]|uniref:ABC transporter substrate-binding protein n=1 Tax=Cryobacterium sp. M91 TaxID=2048294 RepID=UPI001E618E7A|nr:ABC transporter substrate-binding protein [Cryobacterium sp. M91]